jgi:hypothetical protein
MRLLAIAALAALAGCADPSRGASLAECRLKYYLDDPAAQGARIPDCMRVKSFASNNPCDAPTGEQDWDVPVATYPFDNPGCYRPIGSTAWMATLLSPM